MESRGFAKITTETALHTQTTYIQQVKLSQFIEIL